MIFERLLVPPKLQDHALFQVNAIYPDTSAMGEPAISEEIAYMRAFGVAARGAEEYAFEVIQTLPAIFLTEATVVVPSVRKELRHKARYFRKAAEVARTIGNPDLSSMYSIIYQQLSQIKGSTYSEREGNSSSEQRKLKNALYNLSRRAYFRQGTTPTDDELVASAAAHAITEGPTSIVTADTDIARITQYVTRHAPQEIQDALQTNPVVTFTNNNETGDFSQTFSSERPDEIKYGVKKRPSSPDAFSRTQLPPSLRIQRTKQLQNSLLELISAQEARMRPRITAFQ